MPMLTHRELFYSGSFLIVVGAECGFPYRFGELRSRPTFHQWAF